MSERIIDTTNTKQNNLDLWEDIYNGNPPWGEYRYTSIAGARTHKRKLLNMAKEACAEMTSLLWAEPPIITLDDSKSDVSMANILNSIAFNTNMQKWIEYQLALGFVVIKVIADDDGVKLDYVHPRNFKPLRFENNICVCAEICDIIKKTDGTVCKLIELHELNDGVYTIDSSYTVNGVRKPLSSYDESIDEHVEIYGLTAPLFIVMRNPLVNNLDVNSDIGISMFSNAIPTLETIDTMFDSLNSEIVLGRKRIIVPNSAVKTVIVDGVAKRNFDPTDEVFVALESDDTQALKIVDNSMELRVDSIIQALNTTLDIYSMQLGFSQGSFSFDGKSMKTATEVISENSKTYKTKTKYKTALEHDIKIILKTIAELNNILYSDKIKIENIQMTWFDSVYESDDDKYTRVEKQVKAGLLSKRTALKTLYGWTDDEITKELELIKEESI